MGGRLPVRPEKQQWVLHFPYCKARPALSGSVGPGHGSRSWLCFWCLSPCIIWPLLNLNHRATEINIDADDWNTNRFRWSTNQHEAITENDWIWVEFCTAVGGTATPAHTQRRRLAQKSWVFTPAKKKSQACKNTQVISYFLKFFFREQARVRRQTSCLIRLHKWLFVRELNCFQLTFPAKIDFGALSGLFFL